MIDYESDRLQLNITQYLIKINRSDKQAYIQRFQRTLY